MSPSVDLLLTHYREELRGVLHAVPPDVPSCPPGEELLWAETGEAAGWLSPDRAMTVRRLAQRVRFYAQRAGDSQLT
jgi:hypothetical protein